MRKVEAWRIDGALAAFRDPNEEVQRLGLWQLAELRGPELKARVDPRTVEAILSLLEPGQSIPMRIAALKAYVALGAPGGGHRKAIAQLLTERVPALRRRLLAPFRDSLLADACLDSFKDGAYYAGSSVRDRATGHESPLLEALAPGRAGQAVLVGESGLGKSMFLRHLAATSPRTLVYLTAERCAGGVLEAVQSKLAGQADDPAYLRNLVWAGALDLLIDGLNEVTAETRARISEFTEKHFRGNVLMATQPIEWRPPATAKVYTLLPLAQGQIEEFLGRREPLLQATAPVRGEAYRAACAAFLEEVLRPEQPEEMRQAALRILSNPMDLATVGEMIGRGERPDLLRLQEQQYRAMAEDFAAVHAGQAFPLAAFAETVYQMRLEDRSELPDGELRSQLECMERFKMVLRRHEGKDVHWVFRHDKVMELFLVHAFLGPDNPRPGAYLDDPRFRGVYFLLATLLPYEQAMALRERLVQYAADTKDHSVSDTFVQLLRPRASAAAAAPA